MKLDFLFSPVVGLEVDHGEGKRRPGTCHIHVDGVTFLRRKVPFKSLFINTAPAHTTRNVKATHTDY